MGSGWEGGGPGEVVGTRAPGGYQGRGVVLATTVDSYGTQTVWPGGKGAMRRREAACEKGRERSEGAGNLDHNTAFPAAAVVVTPLPSGHGHDMLAAPNAGPCVHSIRFPGQWKASDDLDVVPSPGVISLEDLWVITAWSWHTSTMAFHPQRWQYLMGELGSVI